MEKYKLLECYSDANALISGEKCHVSDADARLLRRGYHAAQSYTDTQIGKVMAELVHQGLERAPS